MEDEDSLRSSQNLGSGAITNLKRFVLSFDLQSSDCCKSRPSHPSAAGRNSHRSLEKT